MALRHKPQLHERLITILADSQYTLDYVDFCSKYTTQRGIDGPRLELAGITKIFKANDIECKLIKQYKVFEFDREDIAGWTWHGSLVVKRYDLLEPMMEGTSESGADSVGSTLLMIAREAGQLRHPPLVIQGGPRPEFDGDMRSMERMIPDLVQLFRSMKDVIRQRWSDAASV